MTSAPVTVPGRFLRNTVLGSTAVYEVIAADGDLVTAEVVRAPGLLPGARVRLLADAVRAMAPCDAAGIVAASRRSPSAVRRSVGVAR